MIKTVWNPMKCTYGEGAYALLSSCHCLEIAPDSSRSRWEGTLRFADGWQNDCIVWYSSVHDHSVSLEDAKKEMPALLEVHLSGLIHQLRKLNE